MRRDDLPNAIGRALIAKNDVYDGEADVLMPIIDAYADTVRAELRDQIIEALDVNASGVYPDEVACLRYAQTIVLTVADEAQTAKAVPDAEHR